VKVVVLTPFSRPSSHHTTVTVISSLNLREYGAVMLINFRSSRELAPPSAFRMRCELTLLSTKAHCACGLKPEDLSLPDTVGEPEDVGTSLSNSVFDIVPFKPARWPPTRATTSSEESRSQRPGCRFVTGKCATQRMHTHTVSCKN
jgi:hypothetical protein